MKPYIPAIIVLSVALVLLAIGGYIALPLLTRTADTGSAPVTATTSFDTASTSNAAAATPASGTFTLAQVAQHNSAASCWTVIDGKVLDVTSFISSHPGGRTILQACGIDASVLFHNVRDHAGKRAQNELSALTIGTLAP